jgi:hypothetical protein
MEWTMPRPLVQGIAALLALAAVGSFAMGIVNAPERGRMPGERAPGVTAAPVAAINATEATPLSQERIEAPPKPVEKPVTNTQPADDSDDDDTTATNTTPPPTATTTAPVVNATNTTPTILPPDTNPSPPQEEPPH